METLIEVRNHDVARPDNRVTILEAAEGASRRSYLEEQSALASQSGTKAFIVQCHFDDGGPWAGPHEMIAPLFEQIRRTQPDLVVKHSLELIYVIPQLRHQLSVKNPT
ncbi:MAG TPA: hypothetical protein VG649_18055, partial [Candidatus Angelobacter sp.]|nr:hypothetical protein [Candidatus Angelobacter sp.]